MALTDKLTAIANAVRSLTGTTAKLSLTGMADAINAYEPPAPSYDTPSIDVSTGGLITASANGKSNTQQLTVQAGKTVTPSTSEQTAVSAGRYTTGAVKVAAVSYDTPSIEVSTGGLITASANGKSGTKQLSTKAGATITPTKSQQTAVASQTFTTGAVTVAAIPSQYIVPSGSQTLTKNDTYDVTSLAEVIVNVAGDGGGLPGGISAFDFGTISVSSAFTNTRQTFNHKLGTTPDLMIVWHEGNVAQTYSMLAAIRGSDFGWRSSAYNSHYAYHGNSSTTVTWANSNNASYGISNMTASSFQLASHSTSYYWRAGTYNYIALKFS